jgi:hypothetical protein
VGLWPCILWPAWAGPALLLCTTVTGCCSLCPAWLTRADLSQGECICLYNLSTQPRCAVLALAAPRPAGGSPASLGAGPVGCGACGKGPAAPHPRTQGAPGAAPSPAHQCSAASPRHTAVQVCCRHAWLWRYSLGGVLVECATRCLLPLHVNGELRAQHLSAACSSRLGSLPASLAATSAVLPTQHVHRPCGLPPPIHTPTPPHTRLAGGC